LSTRYPLDVNQRRRAKLYRLSNFSGMLVTSRPEFATAVSVLVWVLGRVVVFTGEPIRIDAPRIGLTDRAGRWTPE